MTATPKRQRFDYDDKRDAEAFATELRTHPECRDVTVVDRSDGSATVWWTENTTD